MPRVCGKTHRLSLAVIAWLMSASACPVSADDPLHVTTDWTKSGLGGAQESFLIRGTGDRNNPLRRRLDQPFSGDEIFVHFRLRYDADSIDRPPAGDGEFFVLWFDEADGGDRATHAGNVPNVGIHVSGNENRFMVRFHSARQSFSDVSLAGDREFQVTARLSKSESGAGQPFNRLEMWIDPAPHRQDTPDAVIENPTGINRVGWFGFSTGGKTERDDRIEVSDIRLAKSWRAMLGLPERTPAPIANTNRESESAAAHQRSIVRKIDFRRHVLPILQTRCFECHRGPENESGLRLDVLDEVMNQTTPGNADSSRMIAMVTAIGADRMPPEGKKALSPSEISILRDWIDEGLAWDEKQLPTPVPVADHWSFDPIRRPEVPSVRNATWVRTPVDAFIARRHERLGLSPASLAPPATLMRRIALDLTGLPVNDDFVHDEIETRSPHELADQLTERLLISAAYGERWGRHWLDNARWAESNGHQHNRDREHAWRYRDYVIKSFQTDRPFDQFVRQQIAGDELGFSNESLIASGFLAAARYSGNELDPEIQRNDILVDVVNTTAKAMLGLTMECAQCHTHKFDPISIRDYYRFQAFFSRGEPGNLVLQESSEEPKRLIEARWEMFDDVHARLVAARRKNGVPEPILVTPTSVKGAMKGAEREYFRRMESEIARLPQAWGWYSPSTASSPLAIAPHLMRWPLPRDEERLASAKTYVRIRGDVKAVGPEVTPGWPLVFGPTPADLERPRTALADWITSPENPLTARVWVNRIWQWHFGRGLVETSGDFGTQGSSPTHPDLLDWLACELIDSGWSTRHIHRLILRSNTYRQSSDYRDRNHQVDPDNECLWRWMPRRLEAEAIRDIALAAAGQLDRTVGGRSVPIGESESSVRRSVYLRQKRDRLPESLMVFDAPSAVTSCSRRRTSTVSLQPLYLLNSPFMNRMARAMSRRVEQEAAESDQALTAIRLVLGRPASDEEIRKAREFIAETSLQDLCQALMSLSEFVYIN